MSDSIKVVFLVSSMPLEEACEAWNLETWTKRKGRALSGKISGVKTRVISPLSGIEYVITPLINWSNPQSPKFIGFKVSVNLPACSIGINALIQTDVYYSIRIAFYLLKNYLVDMGVSPEQIADLKLNNSEIDSVTFTYLIPFDDHDSALLALTQATARRDALFWNYSTKVAGSQGRAEDNTWYLNVRNRPKFKIYVKKEALKKVNIPTSAKDHIFEVSGRHLRVEVDLTKSELRKIQESIGMEEDIAAWRDREVSQKAYAVAFEKLRRELRLDENLRLREIKNTEKKLTQQQRIVLEDYFKGVENVVLRNMSNTMRSKIKMIILRRYRIDIDLPWARHRLLAPLAWMILPPPFELDLSNAYLAPYIFNRHTARKAIKSLKRCIEAPRNAYASEMTDEELSNSLIGKVEKPQSMTSIRNFDSLQFPYL